MLKEFKEFATRGNIFDMAIGIIIGGAFQKIVTSLVNDIVRSFEISKEVLSFSLNKEEAICEMDEEEL